MSALVLDCSATMPWIFGSERTKATDRLLAKVANGAKAWVPTTWNLQLGNVLLGARRKRLIDQAGIDRFIELLKAFDLERDAQTMNEAWPRTWSLAESHHLSIYDATYLELALRRGLPLATLDRDLQRAAKANGVRLLL